MTEAEWLACDDLNPLLQALAGRAASDRKLRLFCCACYRGAGLAGEVVRVAERYADGRAKAVTLRNANRLRLATGVSSTAQPLASQVHLVLADAHYARAVAATVEGRREAEKARAEGARQVAVLRDIFGNPFRPVAFLPEWRTGTAIAIARGMYASRDFAAMPILADALQDAGCEDSDVLSHCREPGAHVRGCWVVDLVLGLS